MDVYTVAEWGGSGGGPGGSVELHKVKSILTILLLVKKEVVIKQ